MFRGAAGVASPARPRGALRRTAAAFVAFAGPLDLLTRSARRSSPRAATDGGQ